ncbi:MAG: hypothetical protein L0Y62_01570, partial [Nitrospirae bacterium]|nr:hypothetical protein [Nitrospirota bacterium]
LSASYSGQISTRDPYLKIRGGFDLFGTGRFGFSSFMSSREKTFSIKGETVYPERMYRALLSDYVKTRYDMKEDIQLSGLFGIDTDMKIREDGFDVKGLIRIQNGSIRTPESRMAVSGVNMNLPIDLFHAANAHDTTALNERDGFIRIDAAQKADFKVKDIYVPVRVLRNAIYMPSETNIAISGGGLRIKELKIENILSDKRRLNLSLSLQDFDLGRFTRGIGFQGIDGRMDMELRDLEYKDGALKTDGVIAAQVFDGEVKAINLAGSNIFSSKRRILSDITFKGIDLEKLTHNVRIGKITGIIEGELNNLVIEYGEPSRFALDLRSVRKNGVSQVFSTDAVENISVLGTGSEGVSAVLASGLNQFFKEYPYSKIGMRCNLENDVFIIRGTIFEGGREYIVRRSFFKGIDIINQNPDNKISFQDMQERLKRIIKRSNAGESGGKVVVK